MYVRSCSVLIFFCTFSPEMTENRAQHRSKARLRLARSEKVKFFNKLLWISTSCLKKRKSSVWQFLSSSCFRSCVWRKKIMTLETRTRKQKNVESVVLNMPVKLCGKLHKSQQNYKQEQKFFYIERAFEFRTGICF